MDICEENEKKSFIRKKWRKNFFQGILTVREDSVRLIPAIGVKHQ